MRSRALLEMVKGRWREFVREPSALYFVILMPIVWMAIMAGINAGVHEHVGIGWLTTGTAPAVAENVRHALTSDASVRLVDGDDATLNSALRRGDILLVIEPHADRSWTYRFDPANRDASRARMLVDYLVQSGAGVKPAIAARDEPMSVPGTRYLDFLMPGLLALSITTTSLFGTGAVIVVSRRENLLKRYLATPMHKVDYILSHIIGRFFSLAIEVAAVLGAGALLFSVPLVGHIATVLLVSVLGAAAFTA